MACEDLIPVARVRARTISVKRLSKRALAVGAATWPSDPDAPTKPRTWGECKHRGLGTVTPCPFVSCKHHLYLDVNDQTGSIKLNFPGREPDELTETCALAVVQRNPDGLTLEETGRLANLTRERTRQIEQRNLAALRPGIVRAGVAP